MARKTNVTYRVQKCKVIYTVSVWNEQVEGNTEFQQKEKIFDCQPSGIWAEVAKAEPEAMSIQLESVKAFTEIYSMDLAAFLKAATKTIKEGK